MTPPTPLAVLASSKTRKHIHAGSASSFGPGEDPWAHGQDAWAKYRNGQSEAPKATAGAASKIKEVQQQLKQEVDDAVQTSLAERRAMDEATEHRFQKLETGLTELRAQGQKFESWFSEAGRRVDQQASEVDSLQKAVQSQRHEIGQLHGQIATQGEILNNTVSQAVVTMRNDLNTAHGPDGTDPGAAFLQKAARWEKPLVTRALRLRYGDYAQAAYRFQSLL